MEEDEEIIRSIKRMLKMKVSKTEIAHQLSVSRTTLYQIINKNPVLQRYSIRFSQITDTELDQKIMNIKSRHPNAGSIIVQGHLRSEHISVPRSRIRDSLHRVDSNGTENRRTQITRRRVYNVPGPNFLWHLDGTHKLIRWRLVVHVGVDGFSRLIIFAQCSNNNRANTVGSLFETARAKYENPLRIRTDEGGENTDAWRQMYELYPVEYNPVIVGSSVHNQRVERMHRDINNQVINHFYNLFYEMESTDSLNPANPTDLFCLHYVFIPTINKRLQEFLLAHNNHNISTARNYTPMQLFTLNLHVREEQEFPDPFFGGRIIASALDMNNLPYVDVPAIDSPLTDTEFNNLKHHVDPIAYDNPIDAFQDTAAFIAQMITNA